MLHYFCFDNHNSNEYGLIISRKKTYSSPKRSQQSVSIPGRNGNIIYDNGSFENVSISYTCSLLIENDIQRTNVLSSIKAWLLKGGYHRLDDSYDPYHYRSASLESAIDISENTSKILVLEIKFSCKPFKMLLSGDMPITLSTSNSTVVYNPTLFSAEPVFELRGKKEVTITLTNDGNNLLKKITLPNTVTTIFVNSEIMAVYDDAGQLLNSGIEFTEFPELKIGETSIGFVLGTGASLSSAKIYPKWRNL